MKARLCVLPAICNALAAAHRGRGPDAYKRRSRVVLDGVMDRASLKKQDRRIAASSTSLGHSVEETMERYAAQIAKSVWRAVY